MEIWLKEGKKEIRFPVLPPTFSVNVGASNESIRINTVGEVNLIGTKDLKTVPLESFFPNQAYSFLQFTNGLLTPYEYVNVIDGFIGKKPRLIITDTNINMPVTIESFTYSEEDGTGDVSFSIEMKEYRTISKKKNTGSASLASKISKITANAVIVAPYTVKKGDTLKKIAKKITGKAANSTKIYMQNKTVIEKAAKKNGRKSSSKGKYLYKGTKLVIQI